MKKIIYLFTFITILLSNILIAQTVKEEWAIGNNAEGISLANSIILNSKGDVIVCGSEYNSSSSFDYLIIKYNNLGIEQWRTTYNGPANDTDRATKMVIDLSDNIYVTGFSKGEKSEYDFATLKINDNGKIEWEQRFDNNYNTDYVSDLMIDMKGNVYITGCSYDEKNIECITIKYNNLGINQWVVKYPGAYPQKMKIDNKNNIYITGHNAEKMETMIQNFFTIKYDDKGNKLWMNTYNETGNGYNRADGIDVDDFGNVFVRGWNQTYAYITLKYDKNGKQQWAQFYKKKDGSTGILANNNILVDKNGNVYILGNEEIENKNTFILIKYNNNGIEQWLKKFDTGKKCYACCLNIDSDNNIYITGDGFLTVKYDTFGNEITNFSHDDTDHNLIRARSVVLDKQNNLYITGCIFINKTKMDFLTIKFSQFSINNKESQIFTDAQKAFNEGKYILVLELLKDFPLDNVLYFDAVSLMNEALVYITSNNYQNFVTVSGSISCGCSKNISGYIVFEDMNTRLPVGRCGITSNGYYCIVLPSGKIYSYYIDSKDFYPISRVVDFTSLKQNLNHKDNITIVSYEEMKNQQLSIRINNIFFDFNKSELQPESYPELDRLYKFLNDNSDINVEISGHTDNIGADEYNITLSNARANSVKEYLVSKGINSSRIISKGYGKSNPVATNDTDEGRQLNRRVEFKILK